MKSVSTQLTIIKSKSSQKLTLISSNKIQIILDRRMLMNRLRKFKNQMNKEFKINKELDNKSRLKIFISQMKREKLSSFLEIRQIKWIIHSQLLENLRNWFKMTCIRDNLFGKEYKFRKMKKFLISSTASLLNLKFLQAIKIETMISKMLL